MNAAEETLIATQARDWHVRQLGGLTPAEADALRDWLDASAAHSFEERERFRCPEPL